MTSQLAAAHDLEAGSSRGAGGPRDWAAAVATVLFFALLLVYVVRVIDPRLLYHVYVTKLPGREGWLIFPEFFVGWPFLKAMLHQPGGPAEYVGAGLSQFFYYDHVGAIILTGVAVCAFFTTRGIAAAISDRRSGVLPFVPPVLLVVIWNQYSFHLADQLAFLAAIAAVRLYVGVRRPGARAVCFVLGSAVLYYVTGGAYLLAAAMCGLFELLCRRRTVLAAVCFAVGALTPLVVGNWLLGAGVVAAYARLTGPYPLKSPIEVFGGVREVIAPAVLGGCLIAIVVALARLPDADTEPPTEQGDAAGGRGRLRRKLTIAAYMALAGALLFATYAKATGLALRINYYSKMRMWDELLHFAQRRPEADLETVSRRQINRALFETGQLGSRMFSFRQTPDALLPDGGLDMASGQLEDDLLAMGSVNRAEYLASESLAMRGPTPHTLRVLAIVFMAKREPQAAKVFLNHLAKDIVHRQWARQHLSQLAQNPELPDDPEIQRIRRFMQTEVVIDDGRLEPELRRLLDANEGNRMAFDYMIAHCLLLRDLGQAVVWLEGSLAGIHYDVLPTHYAEALIIQDRPTDSTRGLGDLTVGESTALLGRRASAILARHRYDPERLAKAMASAMPGSYFRYYHTGQSGGSAK